MYLTLSIEFHISLNLRVSDLYVRWYIFGTFYLTFNHLQIRMTPPPRLNEDSCDGLEVFVLVIGSITKSDTFRREKEVDVLCDSTEEKRVTNDR